MTLLRILRTSSERRQNVISPFQQFINPRLFAQSTGSGPARLFWKHKQVPSKAIRRSREFGCQRPIFDMEQSSYFFSDCIDLDGGSPYPGTLQDEVVVATAEPLSVSYAGTTSTMSKHPYTSTTGTLVPSPRSTLAQSPVMSFQDVPYTDLLCDPVLLAGSENNTRQTKATEPLTPSSYDTRGSVGTRSSTNSIPSVTEPHAMTGARNSSPPQKRKIRHSKATKSIKEEDEDEDEGPDKRQKFLEKNRIAASKCREKKKKWVHDLEHNKSELERQNFELRLEHRNLINDLSQTKNMLMTHSACKDPNIDRWLDNEARRIVQTTGASVFSANPLAYAPPNARHRNDSLVSAVSMADLDSPSRRASLAYSQGKHFARVSSLLTWFLTPLLKAPSSINDSPIDPFLPMPSLSPKVKEEPVINLDHMSEDMLRS